ncbi:tRNA(His) guanylyltransferase 1-like isoform X1 [Benincasa hispida]|uniref:tRNA(His) guanylyltransferase 1-like isoform X1 n=2 Tax=Benincasa hispida TaxID=102211 RepID=UPI0019012851|nr:tRNA(His) guanylyltransferase 1-like isoform X1 [Benincasa hispida]
MANSKYEYVKLFEVDDEVMLPNLIVVRVDGLDFRSFSEVHGFVKPNDEKALELMNCCAMSTMEMFSDVIFSYGFNDEYSFVFKKTSKFYQRRASKLYSLVVSFFTSVYITKWQEFFPQKNLRYPPSFRARVVCCASIEVLQAYLAWRQQFCHISNLDNTCFWKLVECGKTDREAHDFLKVTEKKEKHELLFQKFNINYANLNAIFRQGSCILTTKVEYIVKYHEDGTPVKRLRRKATVIHSPNIAGQKFWNEHSILLKELGAFTTNIDKINPDYVRSFQAENKLMPATWIVIRIDGCHFHRFSEVHVFEKPNDQQALNLMNSCAVAVMEKLPDLVFSYGVSDEYSFVLKKDSQIFGRGPSEIVSIIVSLFSSLYVMKWREFFPHKELKYPPSFDGRAVCYPSREILQDYLAWRQVDCHINNQYNTCFWELVKSGKSKSEAQACLKGTQAQEKERLLNLQFNISYNELPLMFRQGSSAFWDKKNVIAVDKNPDALEISKRKIVVVHSNIIEPSFWEDHPWILD